MNIWLILVFGIAIPLVMFVLIWLLISWAYGLWDKAYGGSWFKRVFWP